MRGYYLLSIVRNHECEPCLGPSLPMRGYYLLTDWPPGQRWKSGPGDQADH